MEIQLINWNNEIFLEMWKKIKRKRQEKMKQKEKEKFDLENIFKNFVF